MLVSLLGMSPRRTLATAAAPPPPDHQTLDRIREARPPLSPAQAAPLRPAPPADVLAEEATALSFEATLAALGAIAYTLPSVETSVRESSTWREIARELQLDARVLTAYNGLPPDIADEAVGREALALPTGVVEWAGLRLQPDPPPPETVTYTVAEGDTLLGIALRFGVDLETLAAANELPSVDLIRAGDQLQVSLWSRPAAAAAPGSAPIPRAASQTPAAQPATAPTLAVEQAPSAAPSRPTAPLTYEVAPGDTVSVIAERFGVDTETIVGANSLSSADRIRIGDQLTVLPISGVMHTVKAGQTLSQIAGLYKVDLGPIIDFNYLDDADLITVGKELIVPGAKPLPAPPATPAATEYRVSPGDTLTGIAVRFGASPAAIAQANGLLNPDQLSIGGRLLIPGGAALAQQQVVTRNLPVFTPAPSANVQVPASAAANTISSIAMGYQGARYTYGGTSPSGFDCSGFVYYVMAQAGHPVSRGIWGQYNAGPHPSKANLQPGDIVSFQNTYMPGLSHNGIYLGDGQFINAVDERSGVKISNLNDPYWSSRWFGATRIG